ncbi:MAG: hypothetical protein Q8Q04_00230 [archaeon]|nr:hypothetical protein [archaeon]
MVKELEYFFSEGTYKVKESELGVKGTACEKNLGDYVDTVNHIRDNKNGLKYAKVSSGPNEREAKSLKQLIADLTI